MKLFIVMFISILTILSAASMMAVQETSHGQTLSQTMPMPSAEMFEDCCDSHGSQTPHNCCLAVNQTKFYLPLTQSNIQPHFRQFYKSALKQAPLNPPPIFV